MNCPKCNAEGSAVVDSRPVLNGAAVRRRRACTSCAARFTTYERRGTPPRPGASESAIEILHLRAALALARRSALEPHAAMMVDAALARDWPRCEGLEALAIVIICSDTTEQKGPA